MKMLWINVALLEKRNAYDHTQSHTQSQLILVSFCDWISTLTYVTHTKT